VGAPERGRPHPERRSRRAAPELPSLNWPQGLGILLGQLPDLATLQTFMVA
jgi:hypothetical protein